MAGGNRFYKTIKVDRLTGKVEGETSVRSPDNVVIDADGKLWIASHLNVPIDERCENGHAGPCSEVVFQHKGEPMGYATVALPYKGRLYLGSASGDRIASIAL
jgi:secreted PhoX family phosphatase